MKKENIKAAIDALPEQVIKDALALVLSEPADTQSQRTADEQNLESEKFNDIFELMAYLKRTYSFPELDRLLLEGGKLLFKDGDRRIVIAERSTSRISVARRNPSPQPPEISNIPQSPPPARTGGSEQPERFRRLELDE